jgi:hypothetical protein
VVPALLNLVALVVCLVLPLNAGVAGEQLAGLVPAVQVVMEIQQVVLPLQHLMALVGALLEALAVEELSGTVVVMVPQVTSLLLI